VAAPTRPEPWEVDTGRQGRRRALLVGGAVIVACLLVSGYFVFVRYGPRSPPGLRTDWSIAMPPGADQQTAAFNGTLFLSKAVFTEHGPSDTGEYSVWAINITTGNLLWRSANLTVQHIAGCCLGQFVPTIAVVPGRVVLAVAVNGASEGAPALVELAAFSPSSGALITSSSLALNTTSPPVDLASQIGGGAWPVVGGTMFVWFSPDHYPNQSPTLLVIQAISLSTFQLEWNQTVPVTLGSWWSNIQTSPRGFVDGAEVCIAAQQYASGVGGGYPGGPTNGTVACVSENAGTLEWQRNVSGGFINLLGATEGAGAIYFLNTSSGAVRIEGFNESSGAPLAPFPATWVDVSSEMLYQLAFVHGMIVSYLSSSYSGYIAGTQPRDPVAAFSPSGVLLWNNSLSWDGRWFARQYLTIFAPEPLSGDRLLIGVQSLSFHDTAVLEASTGAVDGSFNQVLSPAGSGLLQSWTPSDYLPLLTYGPYFVFGFSDNIGAGTP
jgi:hypothetical protein